MIFSYPNELFTHSIIMMYPWVHLCLSFVNHFHSWSGLINSEAQNEMKFGVAFFLGILVN